MALLAHSFFHYTIYKGTVDWQSFVLKQKSESLWMCWKSWFTYGRKWKLWCNYLPKHSFSSHPYFPHALSVFTSHQAMPKTGWSAVTVLIRFLMYFSNVIAWYFINCCFCWTSFLQRNTWSYLASHWALFLPIAVLSGGCPTTAGNWNIYLIQLWIWMQVINQSLLKCGTIFLGEIISPWWCYCTFFPD